MPGSHKRAPSSFQVMAGHDNIGDDDDEYEEKDEEEDEEKEGVDDDDDL